MLEHAFNYLLILATLCNMVTKSNMIESIRFYGVKV